MKGDMPLDKLLFEKTSTLYPNIREGWSRNDNAGIENCIGNIRVPLGLAGPLRVTGPEFGSDNYYAPLATTEAALVASCSRGCKALQSCGGTQFKVVTDVMCRAPLFYFDRQDNAMAFTEKATLMRSVIQEAADSTSSHITLISIQPHVVNRTVHLRLSYKCGDSAGHNMATLATQAACERLVSLYGQELGIQRFVVESGLSADKNCSWLNVYHPRGSEVHAWAVLTNQACQSILGVTSIQFYRTYIPSKDAEVRSGTLGSNINVSNIVAAIFLACGQDVACISESLWSHLSIDYDSDTGDLHLHLYIPSLSVGTVGGGTVNATQRECLEILKCNAPERKNLLAGLIASFALALDISTIGAISNNTFASAHGNFRRPMAKI